MPAAYAAALRLVVVDLGDGGADLEAEEAIDLTHPVGVALGQVVVDRDQVHATARERVQVRGEGRDEGLALTGLHLRDPAEVQGGTAHDLHVEVPLTEGALARLADRRERLGEEVVEVLLLLVVVVDLVELFPPRGGERTQLVVGARFHLGLVDADDRCDRFQRLELAALAGVQDLVEESHEASQCRGDFPAFDPA